MIPEHAESLYLMFEREGIPLLLAGGWAVCHHGYSRLTIDVDWVCSRENEIRAIELMEKSRFVKTTEGMASRFKLRNDLAFPPVDLIWVGADSFARLSARKVFTGRMKNIPVVGLEGLLAMKLHALKNDVERKGKDLVDIRFLLDYNAGAITEDKLQAMCDRFGGPDTYRKIKGL